MAVFSVNQATQMYVGAATKGTIGDDLYYTVAGERTDIIKDGTVISNNQKTVAQLAASLKFYTPTITVAAPVAGHSYVVRLIITTDSGVTNSCIKSVGVVAASDVTASSLATEIKKALEKAATRDIEPLYTVAVADAKVTITPKVLHKVGKMLVVPSIIVEVADLNDDAETLKINGKNGWVNNKAVQAVVSSKTYSAGALEVTLAKLKDLEYFCAGEKGDIYRGAGYPNDIPFTSKLGSLADTWYVRTIHYYDTCSNEAVQKSEKTIVIVSSATIAE